MSRKIAAHMAFPPIEDYGVIGNGHTAALVSSRGSIDWLCLPRFDSPSLFARILDLERGGYWCIQPTAPFESTHTYAGETNVLETVFTCAEGRVKLIDFMDISSERQQQHRAAPGRLIRVLAGLAGTVELVSICVPRPNYARDMPDFTGFDAQVTFGPLTISGPVTWQVDPTTATLACCITLQPGDRVAFTLETQADADQPHPAPQDALATTTEFWQGWAAACTYQGPYRDAVIRSALTLQLLIYVPSGAIVAAPTTSLPETIGGERNWDYRFTWIRDSALTLYALLLAGYLDDERPYFDWVLHTVRVKGTGISILYPITDDGQTNEQILDHLRGYRNSQPVRIGNAATDQIQLDVYGEILHTLHFAWKTGKYDPTGIWHAIEPMLDWVADHWHEPGNGIWEVRGGKRHFVYGKVMLWVALRSGVDMAETLNLSGDVARWRHERDQIRAEVFAQGWSKELGAFKQSYEDANLDAANLLLPVVGFIAGDDPRMQATIDATMQHLVVDGLCYRYRNAPEGVAGTEGAFVLCTCWLINALILAGRITEARAWFEQVLARASTLGLFAEEINPHTGTHLGNFPQAFSHLGVINVAVALAHRGSVGTVAPIHRDQANATSHPGE